MKLFGRSGGYYLFWTGAVYFAAGMYCIFVDAFIPVGLAQLIWMSVLLVPLVIPQVGRYFNMYTIWESSMFGWRKRQIADKADKDINDAVWPEAAPLPEPVVTPLMPEVAKPKADTFDNSDASYTIGINQAGNTQLRVKLDYGSATLTMAPAGVRSLIRQLEATLDDEDEGDEVE